MTIGVEPKVIGVRDILAAVNLRDFFDMVVTELGLVRTSVQLAFASRTRIFPLVLLIALFRVALVLLVVALFGTAIVVIATIRSVVRRASRVHLPRVM